MLKSMLKGAVTAAAACLALLPGSAIAQVRVDLPGIEIRVGHVAPPRLRYERRPHRPGPEYVWLAGAWDWQGTGWIWVPGRWDRPAERGVKWVVPRYRREDTGWRYEPGHWSNQRLVEGDDYRRWRSEHGRRHDDRHDDHHDDHHDDRDRR